MSRFDEDATVPVERAEATAETVASGVATPRTSSGLAHDATMAPPSLEHDATMAPGSQPAQPQGAVIRAGGKEDYRGLVAVDPDHYVVGRELARGGMGRISVARDRRLGRSVALKELLVDSTDLRARFEREARITAKLQHPAIVNLLEAGVWATGEPFYVMKLVTGESLDKVIAARSTLETRMALLPTVIATVDALAYAHDRRVIHRDLKPGNVLVGEYGETVVIDWGLAKDLADTSGAPDVAAGPFRTAATAPGQTEYGAVVGTPAYMPVEQAEGETVDERADVYSLGAMLYHVLTGAPPYTGKTANMILDAVLDSPPTPIEQRVPALPPDLVAIVNKAMARAAADRYPTAKELAADLKKFQTGQLVGAHRYSAWQLVGRWIRRHRTAVTVAAVAAVALTAVGVISFRRLVEERARTDQQRRVALKRGADAEDLLDFMMVDMRDKLQPVGKLDLLDDVAKKAIAYYDDNGADLSLAEKRKRTIAKRNLGYVLAEQGHSDAALAQYRAAQVAALAFAASDPSSTSAQHMIADTHIQIGTVLRPKDGATALAEFKSALAIAEAMATKEPDTDSWQVLRSEAHRWIGEMLVDQGDAAGALASHQKSLAIREQLAAKKPNDTTRQGALALGYTTVGKVLRTQAELPGALARFRSALAINEKRSAADPGNVSVRRDLLELRQLIGEIIKNQGDLEAALVELRAAQAIAKSLADGDPTNASRQGDLSHMHFTVGSLLLQGKNVDSALVDFRAAAAIDERRVAADPTNVEALSALSLDRERIGTVLLAKNDTAGALIEYRAFSDVAEKLAAANPADYNRKRNVALSHINVAKVLVQQGKPADALPKFQLALEVFEKRAKVDTTSADRQSDVALVLDMMASAHVAMADADGAIKAYRAAQAILRPLIEKDPTNAGRLAAIALNHYNVGELLLKRKDKQGARADFELSLEAMKKVRDMHPEIAVLREQTDELATKMEKCCPVTSKKRPH
jgi:tetratricopeptide (TPR) repeat protein